MNRIRVQWEGLKGLPAVSTFYSDGSGVPDLAPLATLFAAFKAAVPSGVTWRIASEGDRIADETGELVGTWSVPTVPAPITATGGATWVGPTGCVVNWKTDSVVNGHRLRGRMFVVPLATGCFDNTGGVGGSTRAPIEAAAKTFAQASNGYLVWSRPRKTATATLPVAAGGSGEITDAVVPSLAAVLRSRRD